MFRPPHKQRSDKEECGWTFGIGPNKIPQYGQKFIVRPRNEDRAATSCIKNTTEVSKVETNDVRKKSLKSRNKQNESGNLFSTFSSSSDRQFQRQNRLASPSQHQIIHKQSQERLPSPSSNNGIKLGNCKQEELKRPLLTVATIPKKESKIQAGTGTALTSIRERCMSKNNHGGKVTINFIKRKATGDLDGKSLSPQKKNNSRSISKNHFDSSKNVNQKTPASQNKTSLAGQASKSIKKIKTVEDHVLPKSLLQFNMRPTQSLSSQDDHVSVVISSSFLRESRDIDENNNGWCNTLEDLYKKKNVHSKGNK